jgi:hypothetical protein
MPDRHTLTTAVEAPSSLPALAHGAAPLKTTAPLAAAIPPTEADRLNRLAAEILQDPLALQHLCDRVYTLLQQDLHRQQERTQIHP